MFQAWLEPRQQRSGSRVAAAAAAVGRQPGSQAASKQASSDGMKEGTAQRPSCAICCGYVPVTRVGRYRSCPRCDAPHGGSLRGRSKGNGLPKRDLPSWKFSVRRWLTYVLYMGASSFGRHIFGRPLSVSTPLPGVGHDEVFALHGAGEMRRTQRK